MSVNQESLNSYTTQKHKRYIFLFQMLGTFIFTYAIGCSHYTVIGQQQNVVHCFALLLPLALAGEVSGGYFNSTITVAAYINRRHKMVKMYVLAQFLGGFLGTVWCWLITGRVIIAYQHQTTSQMIKFIINQIVGSFFFVICVLALTNKFTTHAYKSWQIYISIAVAFYLVRKMTADTPINPATSVFFQIGSYLKTSNTDYLIDLWILIIPSTIGGILGGFFMHKIYEPLLLMIKFKDENFTNESGDQYQDIKASETTLQI